MARPDSGGANLAHILRRNAIDEVQLLGSGVVLLNVARVGLENKVGDRSAILRPRWQSRRHHRVEVTIRDEL